MRGPSPPEQIIFEGRRAVGLAIAQMAFRRSPCARRSNPLGRTDELTEDFELSGIGQPELLKSLGIDLRHGLPGVGENLTDHLQSRITYETNQKVTINDILNSRIRGAMAMARIW